MVKRKIIYHAGPTNSGKTHSALERFQAAKSGVYCGPLRLLATEVFRKTNDAVSTWYYNDAVTRTLQGWVQIKVVGEVVATFKNIIHLICLQDAQNDHFFKACLFLLVQN